MESCIVASGDACAGDRSDGAVAHLQAAGASQKVGRKVIPVSGGKDGLLHTVERTQEQSDAFGRRQVGTVRQWMDRKGYTLVPKLVFIDGRTGTTLYSESVREEILYEASQNTPALSAYFELMDRYLPSFLSALSSQKIRGTRVLLK